MTLLARTAPRWADGCSIHVLRCDAYLFDVIWNEIEQLVHEGLIPGDRLGKQDAGGTNSLPQRAVQCSLKIIIPPFCICTDWFDTKVSPWVRGEKQV